MTHAQRSNSRLYAEYGHMITPRVLQAALRRCTTKTQQLAHGASIAVKAATCRMNLVLDPTRFAAVGRNKRRAFIAGGLALLALAVAALLPAGGLWDELAQGAFVGAALLAAAFGCAAYQFENGPGLPAAPTPADVDDARALVHGLDEQGRGFLGVWLSIFQFGLIALEMWVVLALSRERLFATLKPTLAFAVCTVLALACAVLLVEMVNRLALALRRGELLHVQAHETESDDPVHKAKAALKQKAYSGVIAQWYRGSRVRFFWVRCHKRALGWAALLVGFFMATIGLRLVVAGDNLAELVVLAITAVVSAGTLVMATAQRFSSCDLSEDVAQARRLVQRFHTGDHLRAFEEQQDAVFRSELDWVTCELVRDWSARYGTQQELEARLLPTYEAELARQQAALARALRRGEGQGDASSAPLASPDGAAGALVTH